MVEGEYCITIKSSEEGKVRGRKTLEQEQGLIPALPFLTLDRVDVDLDRVYSVSIEPTANTTDDHQGLSYAVDGRAGPQE